MSPERWKEVKGVFDRLIDLPASERQPLLDACEPEVRSDVRNMLDASEENSQLLNAPIFDLGELGDLADARRPDRIGEYKIIREIGRGGMGAVYEAVRETDDFTQRAALKVIRHGLGSETILRRFRSEQKILAALAHPNIARFLDGGRTADGMPFYAMEYIEGLPVDQFCRDAKPGLEAEILQVVTQTEPIKPSAVKNGVSGLSPLKGDIDNIVLKALHKDPSRRYQSVEQLSEDLRRFMQGLPVSARADTVGYRLRKFVGRNRVATGAAGIVLLTLGGGIAATTWQAVRAERQRVLAEKRFAEVRTRRTVLCSSITMRSQSWTARPRFVRCSFAMRLNIWITCPRTLRAMPICFESSHSPT